MISDFWLYYFLVFLFFLGNIFTFSNLRDKVSCNLFYSSFIILLFCLSVFKDISVGVDNIVYKEIFDWVQNTNSFGIYEPGYVYLNLFSQNISNNFNFFLFLVFTIIFFNINFFIRRISKNHILSITIFFLFFFIEFNSMLRQAIAISFFLRGLIHLNENNNKKYYLTAIIAFLFHYSAIIIFFFPLFSKLRFNNYKSILLLILMFIILTNVGSSLYFTQLESYNKYLLDDETSGLYAIGQSLFAISYLIIYFSTNNNNNNGKRKITISTNFNYWMITLFILTSLVSIKIPVISRFTWYFAIPFLYLIPNNFTYNLNRKKAIGAISLISILVIYQTIIFIYRPQWGGFFPYSTFF
tara:strand:- start:290 stop:1354 length:1065 start_codon:yes stop_codon:yes gene_type:complete